MTMYATEAETDEVKPDPQSNEIWETTTPGSVWVQVRDHRQPNAWRHKKVGGKGTKRITLTVEEREFNQEMVAYENAHLDPFTNGLLYRVSPAGGPRGAEEANDDDLRNVLANPDDPTFEAWIGNVTGEVTLRRLLELCERHGTMYRFKYIQARIDSLFAVGKTSQVAREMERDEARWRHTDI